MLRYLFLAITLLAALSLHAEETKSEQPPLVQPLFEQLEKLSLSPRLDKDGDIIFKKEDRTYVLIFDSRDPAFLLLALPNIWTIESDQERIQVREVSDEVNARAKLARLMERDGHLWVIAEALYAEPTHAVPMLERLIATVDNVVALFGMKMLSRKMD